MQKCVQDILSKCESAKRVRTAAQRSVRSPSYALWVGCFQAASAAADGKHLGSLQLASIFLQSFSSSSVYF